MMLFFLLFLLELLLSNLGQNNLAPWLKEPPHKINFTPGTMKPVIFLSQTQKRFPIKIRKAIIVVNAIPYLIGQVRQDMNQTFLNPTFSQGDLH